MLQLSSHYDPCGTKSSELHNLSTILRVQTTDAGGLAHVASDCVSGVSGLQHQNDGHFAAEMESIWPPTLYSNVYL